MLFLFFNRETEMLKSGRVLESAFLTQASRDYPELNPRPATLEQDMHHGTDVVLEWEDRRLIPIGLTRKMEVEKILRDASKASRMWDFWVEIIIPSHEEEDTAIDNALSYISNEMKEENAGFFALTSTTSGVHVSRLN
jgi:hypothetical protein